MLAIKSTWESKPSSDFTTPHFMTAWRVVIEIYGSFISKVEQYNLMRKHYELRKCLIRDEVWIGECKQMRPWTAGSIVGVWTHSYVIHTFSSRCQPTDHDDDCRRNQKLEHHCNWNSALFGSAKKHHNISAMCVLRNATSASKNPAQKRAHTPRYIATRGATQTHSTSSSHRLIRLPPRLRVCVRLRSEL